MNTMDKKLICAAVIADDITGANDIGIMYAKTGIETVVYSQDKLEDDFEADYPVSIIDTNSRFCTREEAYRRVYEATKCFDKESVKQFYNKQCSVFRGNIGAEFDAMLDALGEEHAMVVAGFPDNGRTTLHGVHYVHGVELKDSQFRNDPVHPMTESDLVTLVQNQTKRKVVSIPYEILDLGVAALRSEIEDKKREGNYLLFDVRDNQDLETIALAVYQEKVICGSSALAYYLGKLNPEFQTNTEEEVWKTDANILSIAGSLTPQTKSQVEYMRKQGYPVITMDTTKLLDEGTRMEEMRRILKEYGTSSAENRLVLIHSMNTEGEVAKTKRLAKEAGIDNTEISELVSGTLSELASYIGKTYGIRKYIICGGDTSASFCNSMKVSGMKVLTEIQPGLPSCISITPPYYELVLKSGSFGDEKFIETAMEFL